MLFLRILGSAQTVYLPVDHTRKRERLPGIVGFVGALGAFAMALGGLGRALAQDPLWIADSSRPAAAPDEPAWRARAVSSLGDAWIASGRQRWVELELFDGERLAVRLWRMPAHRPGAVLWRGEWDGAGPSDQLLLAFREGAVAGTLWHGDRLLRLFGPAGGWVLSEADPAAFPPCEGAPLAPADGASPSDGPPLPPAPPALPPPPGATAGGGALVVDVLTVWTPAARAAAGGVQAMEALLDLAVAEGNLSFANCDAGLTLRLVHSQEVDYQESGSPSTDLSRLRSKTDGYMDEVHALRDAYGADAVALITNTGSACGVGYLMTNVSPNFESSAFQVTRRTCATGNLTYVHEFGHNFGCAHDPENAGGASHSYAYGYRTPNNLHRTVMAYAPGTRRPIFSSPLHTWAGFVMGTSTQDNARALRTNGPTIANWRNAVSEVLDCDQNGVPDGVQIAQPGGDVDQNGVLDLCQSLAVDKLSLSLIFGGTQQLSLNAGPERAGHWYWLLGSLSGVAPATPLFGLSVPLVADPFFDLSLGLALGGLYSAPVGLLDGSGRAQASFQIPPTSLVQLIFTPANHAFVTFTADFVPSFVSTPVPTLFAFL